MFVLHSGKDLIWSSRCNPGAFPFVIIIINSLISIIIIFNIIMATINIIIMPTINYFIIFITSLNAQYHSLINSFIHPPTPSTHSHNMNSLNPMTFQPHPGQGRIERRLLVTAEGQNRPWSNHLQDFRKVAICRQAFIIHILALSWQGYFEGRPVGAEGG